MNELKGKKILFIAPKFFNYEIEIKNKMEELGAYVKYYDERMKNNFFNIALIRLFKNALKIKIKKYYKQIINENKNIKYDYVFFIIPETITPQLLRELKQTQKGAKIILYMWDSFKNRKNANDLRKIFDVIYSFDKEDCKRWEKLKFRPLFYIDKFKKESSENKEKNDLFFIGTGHSDRYLFFRKIKVQIENLSLKFEYYIYLRNKIFFYLKKYFDGDYKSAKIQEFRFKPLSFDKIQQEIKNAKIILDIHHKDQHGLTMRTLEMVGMGKKLITTNHDIKSYDFYNKNNILVIDREDPKLDIEFFKSDYEELPKEVYEKYSIGNWIKEILLD